MIVLLLLAFHLEIIRATKQKKENIKNKKNQFRGDVLYFRCKIEQRLVLIQFRNNETTSTAILNKQVINFNH